MTYIVHGARGSGSSIVEAACAELGVAYEARDLDARNGEHRGEAYAALNPQRKLPALQLEGGEILTESVAIVLTLDERHRDPGLLPPPASPERAQALRWILFLATELYPLVELMDYPERFAPAGAPAAALKARAQEHWQRRWLVLEGNLAGSPYALPGGFSALDLYIATMSRWDLHPAWRAKNLPRVQNVTTAVRARPRLTAVWARHTRQPG